MSHIAVIGGGITGITTAYALLDRGFEVSVFERHRYAAMETSFANGGQLSASNAEVWNHWPTILKGLRWMLRADAPLLVNPKPSWHKYSWMAEFLRAIPRYEANTRETARLAILSQQLLQERAAQYGIAFDCERRGILHVYTDRKEFEHAGAVNRLLTAAGLDRRAVTPEEMRAIEPALSGRFEGGYYTESDFTGDIHRYTCGLADACLQRGADMRFEADIQAVRWQRDGVVIDWLADGQMHDQRFDAVVVCAGVESRRIARMLGDRVNVYPVKGYSITIALEDADSRAAAPWVSLLDDEAKVVTSRLGASRFRIAGTAEFNGNNLDIRADRIAPLVRWCERFFPGVRTEQVVPWAGLRPMMPDMMPRVGAGKRPGVFYNTGHGHLGWTLSSVTAEMVSEAVQRQLPIADGARSGAVTGGAGWATTGVSGAA